MRDREIIVRTSALAAVLAGVVADKFGIKGQEQFLVGILGWGLAELYDRAAYWLKDRLKPPKEPFSSRVLL